MIRRQTRLSAFVRLAIFVVLVVVTLPVVPTSMSAQQPELPPHATQLITEALLLRQSSDPDSQSLAITKLHEVLPVLREEGYEVHLALALIVNAELYHARGDTVRAWSNIEEGRDLVRRIGISELEPLANLVVGNLYFARSDSATARRLWQSAFDQSRASNDDVRLKAGSKLARAYFDLDLRDSAIVSNSEAF